MRGLGQDGGGVGGGGVHLSPRIRQEYTFRHRSTCGTLAEKGQECLTRGEEYIDPSKTQQGRGTKEKNRSVSLVDLPLAGGGTEAAVPSPHQGSCLSQRRNI